ncbi:MAG: 30S ribosomal protein S18 [Candidatus Melainabacteria bacterium]|jgi:ribosomal protein S18
MKKRKRKLEFTREEIDPLNIDLLRKLVSGEGKSARILPHYVNSVPTKFQKKVAKAIKIARQLNLI